MFCKGAHLNVLYLINGRTYIHIHTVFLINIVTGYSNPPCFHTGGCRGSRRSQLRASTRSTTPELRDETE